MSVNDNRPVSPERSGWRDMLLRDRHRLWGWDLPAVDVDFLEYDNRRAKALVEYKLAVKGEPTPRDANLEAMVDLGNRAQVPVLYVLYNQRFSRFKAYPLNPLAQRFIAEPMFISEAQYVELLYRIRNRSVPREILQKVNHDII